MKVILNPAKTQSFNYPLTEDVLLSCHHPRYYDVDSGETNWDEAGRVDPRTQRATWLVGDYNDGPRLNGLHVFHNEWLQSITALSGCEVIQQPADGQKGYLLFKGNGRAIFRTVPKPGMADAPIGSLIPSGDEPSYHKQVREWHRQFQGGRMLNQTLPMLYSPIPLGTNPGWLNAKQARSLCAHLFGGFDQICWLPVRSVKVMDDYFDFHNGPIIFEENNEGWNGVFPVHSAGMQAYGFSEYMKIRGSEFAQMANKASVFHTDDSNVDIWATIGGQTVADWGHTLSIMDHQLSGQTFDPARARYCLGGYYGNGTHARVRLDDPAFNPKDFEEACKADIDANSLTWQHAKKHAKAVHGIEHLDLYEAGFHLPEAGTGGAEKYKSALESLEVSGTLGRLERYNLAKAEEAGIEIYGAFEGPKPWRGDELDHFSLGTNFALGAKWESRMDALTDYIAGKNEAKIDSTPPPLPGSDDPDALAAMHQYQPKLAGYLDQLAGWVDYYVKGAHPDFPAAARKLAESLRNSS